jgi:PAS domain S-box-containing protein
MTISDMENVFENPNNDLIASNGDKINYGSVVKNLSEVVWSIDLTVEPYHIHYLNNPTESFLGNGKLKIPKNIDDWQNAIHQEDRERILDEIVNVLNVGSGSYMYRIQQNVDAYHYVLDRVNVLYDDEKPVRIDGITIDIDSLRKSFLNLEVSQKRLKSIVDSLPDPVFISSVSTGKVLFANEVLFRVFGLTPTEFLGEKALRFYQDSSGRKEYIQKLSDKGAVQNHELVLANNKGELFWVSASTMPLEFQEQESHITILQDITFRKRLESDLKDSNDRYLLAVEGTNDAIWEYDFKHKNSYLSPQFWTRTGYEQLENPLDENLLSKYIHPEDLNDFNNLIEHHFNTKTQDFAIESRLITKDELVIFVFIKARILYSKKGMPLRIVGSITNITNLKETESQLKESEAKYKLISENSSDCICLQDPKGNFVFVSPSSKDILGFAPEDLMKMDLHEIIHSDDLDRVSQRMVKVINKEESDVTISFKAKNIENEFIWLESKAGAVYDSNGEMLYLQTSTRDINDRVLAEEQLRESEERYKLISQNSHDIVSLMDLNGDYIFISPSIKDTMGYEVDEIIGRNTTEFIHPDDLSKIAEEMGEAIATKSKKGEAIFRFKHKNGSWRWLEVKGGVILNDEGEAIYIQSTKTDITEKILTERKLKEKEDQYKLVSENSADVIGLQNANWKFLFLSPSCTTLFGYTPEEFYELDPYTLLKKEEVNYVKDVINKTILTKAKNTKASYRVKRKNGEWVWVESVLSCVLDKDGEVIFLQSSTRDISERMRSIEKERQLSKLKSSFISMASHEFRTPLTTIQSSNELIRMHLDNSPELGASKIGKHVGRIKSELERMNALLKDIFTLGRLDVGKTNLNKDITSLPEILKQVALEHRSTSSDGRIIVIKSEGTERQLNLDSQLISHAIANLISNAFKYSEGAQAPELTVRYFENSVEIDVTDYGLGIPSKDKKDLFESFSRASNVGDIEGTGLGLVIVKQFVKMHGGEVSFESKLGKGSTFKVSIPNV